MGDAIRESFLRVRQDKEAQDEKIDKLSQELNELRKQVVDYMPRLLEQNNQILKRLETLERHTTNPKDPLKEKLVKKYKKGKKVVIKQKILDIALEKEMSLAVVRDTIVIDLRYCSRATFYRYFEELKREDLLETISINGLEIVKILSQFASH